jgi:dipeptide/tripeptide permease
MTNLRDGFNSLHGSPSELWKAYAMKLLASFSYFSLSLSFTLFLSDDFGFSDVEAGTIYGAWGALISIYGIFTGFLVDRMGVAQSLRLGFLITTIARLFIFLTTSRTVLLVMVLVVLPIGNSLGIPVLTTAIRRYTYESNRSFGKWIYFLSPIMKR